MMRFVVSSLLTVLTLCLATTSAYDQGFNKDNDAVDDQGKDTGLNLMKPDKRFISVIFDTSGLPKKTSSHADFSARIWTKSENEFNEVTNNIVDFYTVVYKLISYIHLGISRPDCENILVASATNILGPAADVVDSVKTPLCETAITKQEEIESSGDGSK